MMESIISTVERPIPGQIDKAHVTDYQTLAEIIRSHGLPCNSTQLELAYDISDLVHEGQTRIETCPEGENLQAITHPRLVALMLANLGYPEMVVSSSLMHDVLEDAQPTISPELNRIFGTSGIPSDDLLKHNLSTMFDPQIVGIIDACTNPFHLQEKETRKDLGYFHFLSGASKFPYAIPCKSADRLHNLQTFFAYDTKSQHRNLRETASFYLPLIKTIDTAIYDKLGTACESLSHAYGIDTSDCRPFHYQLAIQVISDYAEARNMEAASEFMRERILDLYARRGEVLGMIQSSLDHFNRNASSLYLPNRADVLHFPAGLIGDFLYLVHCRDAVDEYFQSDTILPEEVPPIMRLGYREYDISMTKELLKHRTGASKVDSRIIQTLYGDTLLDFQLFGANAVKIRNTAPAIFGVKEPIHVSGWFTCESSIILDLVSDPMLYQECAKHDLPASPVVFEGSECPTMPFISLTQAGEADGFPERFRKL